MVRQQKIKVAELFAGVGGFRLGLEGEDFEVVFSNQWEPDEKAQWASKIYVDRFGSEGHSNDDIHKIALDESELTETIQREIPEHDMLVGGFPCQDYSVARTISGELGIKGEKGKLWIPIRNIIQNIRDSNNQRTIKIVLLENVPRLLNSPAKARGRNFALILHELLKMSYHVEWRVINAADYGMPQQRRRVFIMAYRNSNYGTPDINGKPNFGCRSAGRFGPMSRWLLGSEDRSINSNWEKGPFATAFPCDGDLIKEPQFLPADIDALKGKKKSPFGKAGYAWKKKKHTMPDGTIRSDVYMFWTTKSIEPKYDGDEIHLGDILEKEVDPNYWINDKDKIKMYRYIKGEQKEWRIRKADRMDAEGIDAGDGNLWDLYQRCTKGYNRKYWDDSRSNPAYIKGLELKIIYDYSAGAMAFPDSLGKASRTIVTAEIGKSVSRMRHVIEYPKGSKKFRGLVPIELERLNMFPDDWTKYDGISDSRRGFLMGNALVVDIVRRLSKPIANLIRSRSE